MARVFGATSTAEQVLDGIDLKGRRVLITGASAGIGSETARALAAHGADVIGTARDMAKARQVSGAITAAAQAGGGAFALAPLDLASLRSVRECADNLLADGRTFDLLIANAGLMATTLSRTEDGFETDFGTNHLGHFALINWLLPLLRPASRVICLSSSGHRFADIDLEDPNFERTPFDLRAAYGRSKTANALFAVEFDRRYSDRGIRAAAVHPGLIATELNRYMSPDTLRLFPAASGRKAERNPGTKSVEQGAATTVWAAVVARAELIGGRYCEDCHVAEPIADPQAQQGVAPYATDPLNAQRLWALSEAMI